MDSLIEDLRVILDDVIGSFKLSDSEIVLAAYNRGLITRSEASTELYAIFKNRENAPQWALILME